MHASPDVIALLALREPTGSDADREHLLHCDLCRGEVAEIARIVDLGRRTDPDEPMVMPGPHVWKAIRAELGFAEPSAVNQPPSAPVTMTEPISLAARRGARTTTDGQSARVVMPIRRTSRPILIGVLAAAVALVAGIGIGFGVAQQPSQRETVIGEAQLKALPAWTGAKGQAEVEKDAKGKRVLVISVDSARPSHGSRQVWLIDKQVKGMVSLGFLSDGKARLNIPDQTNLSAFPIVDVSAEPGDDPDPKHSGDSIVRGILAP